MLHLCNFHALQGIRVLDVNHFLVNAIQLGQKTCFIQYLCGINFRSDYQLRPSDCLVISKAKRAIQLTITHNRYVSFCDNDFASISDQISIIFHYCSKLAYFVIVKVLAQNQFRNRCIIILCCCNRLADLYHADISMLVTSLLLGT